MIPKDSETLLSILVINALNGVFPLVLQKKYPTAKITCAEIFPFYKHHLRNLGFEVIDWDDVVDMKFDIVVGNPPYQKDNDSGRDDDSLWPKFLAKALNLTQEHGHVAFVTPESWGSLGSNPLLPGSTIRKKHMDTHQMVYVDFTCKKHFQVGTEHELESQGGSWKNFPSDLYDLPVVCSAEQVGELIKAAKLVKSKPTRTGKVTSQLNILDVMREVGVALKGVPKDHKFVRETLESQMPWFRTMQDAIGLAWELVRTHNRS
jgi:hypothetical protein